MMSTLILGHSFVHRLHSFIEEERDARTRPDFGLTNIHWHGIGGRTVPRLIQHDLGLLNYVQPNVVILIIGSNDLSNPHLHPTSIGSNIDDLVNRLHFDFGVSFIVVNQVHKRTVQPHPHYNDHVDIINNYLSVVIDQYPYAKFWKNVGLKDPHPNLLRDGVHLNAVGQYKFYRSVRGAIIKASSILGTHVPGSQ